MGVDGRAQRHWACARSACSTDQPQDLARLDPSDLEDAPDDPYSVGTDPHRAS